MDNYVLFLGLFDHKLGPVCAGPPESCAWLRTTWETPISVIQDGINTKANLLTIRNSEYIIQVRKFNVKNPNLRGGFLRCGLFCVVPRVKPFIPKETIKEVILGIKSIAKKNENNPQCTESDKFILAWQDRLNAQLAGDIGAGQLNHRFRDMLNAIIGYAQLLLDGDFGTLNLDQNEAVGSILKNAKDLIDIKTVN